jgi:hypothetical protein
MDYDENDYDLYEWMDNNILGLNDGEEKEQLIELIFEVLNRLPSEDREILLYKKGVRFVAPITINCVTEQIFIDPIMVRDERTTLCQCSKCNELHLTVEDGRYDRMVAIWLVCLSSDILKRSKEEALYTIAHELAHAYLEHSRHVGVSKKEEIREREDEADKQVIKWGFESELKETPWNYLYGEGEI